MNLPVSPVLPADCLRGAGGRGHDVRSIVWFGEITRRRLWHFDPSNGSNGFTEAPGQIGWALPAEGGFLLCGLQDGLYTFGPESDTFTKLCAVPGEPETNRLNDACTDPWGRVWFGSMDDSETASSGRFHVFDRGEIRAAGPQGIAITNGPAVNASGTRIYFTDTVAQKIMVADLSPAGASEARLFVDTGALFPNAYPDGPVVDAEGHVWTGLYNGQCVARFSPDGALVATVPMPARDITKMAFGGPDFKTGYVTSATKNMSGQDMAQMPMAGSLFAFPSPVAGFAQPRVRLG